MSCERTMKRPAHRPACPIREAWGTRFDLNPWTRRDHRINDAMLAQLSSCRSDEARRLILGISEQYGSGEGPLITDALMVR